MIQVIDAPEAVEAESWQHDAEKTAPLPTMTQPAHRRTGLFALLTATMVLLSKRITRPRPDVAYPHHRFESLVDTIAREQPYLLIKAMAG